MLYAKYIQYPPMIKNISEMKPTINSFNINMKYPINIQIRPTFNKVFQELL